ncbi:MAG: F0F1 ATP synthase subunit B [Bacteroidales bacterium]|nr:F0F1 ATP synthase subunit B [Bacteroidales bacterium]MBR1799835.1 F0F1 ATP synthase subunit B [Bacteroidales bacterium]
MNNPLINPGLGTAFWMLISFGILVFILVKFGWPMLLKSLKKREEAIAESLNAAAKAREEMAGLVAHNEELLRKAKLEHDDILRKAAVEGEQLIEHARTKAKEESDRIVESAKESINYEKLKAMHELKNQIANLSIEIAEKLLEAELADREKADALIEHELQQAHLG